MSRRYSFIAANVLGLLLITGCSDDGLGTRYPVSGTVSYAGQPVAHGRISYIPEAADGRGASGEIKDAHTH